MALPKLEITVALADGQELEVTAINPDLIRYESEAKKRGLPLDSTQAPMTWMTFLAWAALTREKRYAKDWQEFKLTDCVGVSMEDDDAETDPTQPGPESDSA